eukprot:3507357-Rhodomonas_salina.1
MGVAVGERVEDVFLRPVLLEGASERVRSDLERVIAGAEVQRVVLPSRVWISAKARRVWISARARTAKCGSVQRPAEL